MSDEIIKYSFEGDTSELQNATNRAIGALDSFQNKVHNTDSVLNEFMRLINSMATNIEYLCRVTTYMATAMTNTSRAFHDVKNSSDSYSNALRSVALAAGGTNNALSATSQGLASTTSRWNRFTQAVTDAKTYFEGLKSKLSKNTEESHALSNALQGVSNSLAWATSAAKTLLHIDLAGVWRDCIQESINFVENLNLFNVAMGESIDKGKEFVSQFQEVYGMDPSNIMTSAGNFKQLAAAIEMPEQAAVSMSLGMTKLANDIASLYNMPVEQVTNNLKSGLIGMTRAVTRYGADIRSSTLQQTAFSLGISKSVKHMNEASREGLRYITMVRQLSNVNGDWAKTIETPANQLRIMREQLTQLARAIGNLLFNSLAKVLPYINGLIMAIRVAIEGMSKLLGFKPMDFGGSVSKVDKSTDALKAMGDEADKTKKKIKQLQAPFDQLNVISQETDTDTGATPTAGDDEFMDPAIAAAIEKVETKLENVRMKANQVRDNILAWWNLDEGKLSTSMNKIKNTLKNIGSIGTTLKGKLKEAFQFNGNGTKQLNTIKGIFTDIHDWVDKIVGHTKEWASNINFEPLVSAFTKLLEVMRELGQIIGDKLEKLYKDVLLPIGKWTLEKALPTILTIIANIIQYIVEHPEIVDIMLAIGAAIAAIVVSIKFIVWVVTVLIPVIEGILSVVGAIATALGTTGLIVAGIVIAVIAAVAAIATLIILNIDKIKEKFNQLKEWAKDTKEKLKAFFQPVIDNIKKIISNVVKIWEKAKEIFGKIKEIVKAWLKFFKEKLTPLVNWFKENIIDPIKSKINDFKTKVLQPIVDWIQTHVIDKISDAFSKLVKKVANFFISMFNKLIGGLENFINLVIWGLNKVIAGTNTVTGSNISYVGYLELERLEYLATGGVVSGPTQAIIGEGKYDEAVIPLGNSPQLDEMLDKFANKVSDRPVNVVVQIGDEKWDAFTYKSAKRGERMVGKGAAAYGGANG